MAAGGASAHPWNGICSSHALKFERCWMATPMLEGTRCAEGTDHKGLSISPCHLWRLHGKHEPAGQICLVVSSISGVALVSQVNACEQAT